MSASYYITSPPFYIVPAIHYNMEFACQVRRAFLEVQPDCVAVELPENMQENFIRAVDRLPDVSVVKAENNIETLYFPIEPCDASLEALRSGLEAQIPALCIDLDVQNYPKIAELLPDPHAITKIGLKSYYEAYEGCIRSGSQLHTQFDRQRELHMAKRLRELAFSFDKILVVVGLSHVKRVLAHCKDSSYETFSSVERNDISLRTYPEEKTRELLAECGWISTHYEEWRKEARDLCNRKKLHAKLLQEAKKIYQEKKGIKLSPTVFSQLFTFLRNWAHLNGRLLPSFFELISGAKACVDHSFAYEVWKLATEYTYWKNIDNLPEDALSLKDLWGGVKKLHFHLKQPSEKSSFERRLNKEKIPQRLYPPSFFSICSYPPEDSVIEHFGEFLKKKAEALQVEENAKTIPFSTSLEDGIDVKETIRHWVQKKLYVKTSARPPGQAGSCVVIFEEEALFEQQPRFPTCMTWIGEHEQESDMAFYATSMRQNVVGPGIVRCHFGGFMLSYPNRRLLDVWHDPDYRDFTKKQDVLLAASIDYSKRPVIVYVGHHAPSSRLKMRAARQGKKVLYIPISTFPKREITKLCTFHILDSHDKRKIAGDYI